MPYRIKYEDFVKTYSKIYHSAEHYPKVLQKFEQGWNIEKISKSFRIPYQTVWKWTNEKTIPIPFIKYKKIKKQFSKKEIWDMAPMIGYLFGDGGITSNGRVHYCNSEKLLIDEFVLSMGKVFDEEPSIKKEEGIIRVRYPAKIGKTLWCLFDKFSSGKDTKVITPQIERLPLKWKARMLQAWFNDDGSVPRYKVIAIKQKLKLLILFIQNTLSELGIESQIIKDDERWHLRICGYKNLIRFKEKIDFSKGYRKSQRLSEVIKNIKHPHSIVKDKILELLEESPKTRKELSKLLNLELGTVYGHLHGWKRKNKKRKSTRGLIDSKAIIFKKVNRINIYILKNK